MKRLSTLGLLLAISLLPQFLQAQCVYISEYIEGSSNNKCIEIYNGTGAPLDLTAGGYALRLYNNGASAPNTTFPLSGTVAAGDVYVVCNSSAAPVFLAEADATSSVANFNGDDAIELVNSSGTLDVFGQIGTDPGSSWPAGSCNTQNSTLTRSTALTCPSFDGTTAFDASTEWTCHPQDDATNLGSHVPGATVTANQFEFQGTTPLSAVNGASFDITVCATDGSSTETGYSNAINLTNNGSTAGYSVSPSSSVSPTNGCASFTITPSSTGDIDLDFGNSDFTNIVTGAIPVVDRVGSLNFQMVNPCGNDGQNEFISFSTNVDISIHDIGVASRDVFNNDALLYYWGNQVVTNYTNPVTGNNFSGASNNHNILDPAVTADATIINNRITELNNIATTGPNACAGPIFVAVPSTGVIPAGATVVAFLGAGDPGGFDDAANNLDFSDPNHCGQTYYAVFGDGNATGGYFSNSNSRVASLILNGQVYEQDYTPSGGDAGFFFAGESYISDGPCVPAQNFLLNSALIQFYGNSHENGHQLAWDLENTDAHLLYYVEYSPNGIDFQTIHQQVPSSALHYEQWIAQPSEGLNYYRLRTLFQDGNEEYSPIIALRNGPALAPWRIYPNPSRGELQLHFEQAPDVTINYQIINNLGQVVRQAELLSAQRIEQLHLTELPAGMYILRLNLEGRSYTRRLVLVEE